MKIDRHARDTHSMFKADPGAWDSCLGACHHFPPRRLIAMCHVCLFVCLFVCFFVCLCPGSVLLRNTSNKQNKQTLLDMLRCSVKAIIIKNIVPVKIALLSVCKRHPGWPPLSSRRSGIRRGFAKNMYHSTPLQLTFSPTSPFPP